MFDLEQAIAEWRRKMLAVGVKSPVPLDELESHLREDMEGQTKSGAEARQAFETAAERLGPASALQAEFAKARFPDPAKLRRLAAWCHAAYLVFYASLLTRHLMSVAPTRGELLLGITGVAATVFAAYAGWRWVPGCMGLLANRIVRSMVAIVGSVSGIGWVAVLAYFILPRFDFTPGQFAVAVLWALLPVVTLPTLLLGIDPFADSRGENAT